MPGAHDLARRLIPLTLAERAVVMRAAILDRMELAVAPVEPDGVAVRGHEPHGAVRQLHEWKGLDLH